MFSGGAWEALILVGSTAAAVLAWAQREDWVYPTLGRLWRCFVANLPGRRTQLRLMKILDQLQPNGGSSLFDMVAAIETDVVRLLDRQAIMEGKAALVEHSLGIASFTTDSEGRCVYTSQAYRDLVGMEQEDLRGEGWKAGIAEEDVERWSRLWTQAVKDKRDFYGETTYVNVKTREKTPVKVAAYAVRGRANQLVSYVGTAEPIQRPPIIDTTLARGDSQEP